jgi:peptide/nickel transport system substrate-binding protein
LDKYTLEWTLAKPDMRTAFTIDDWYRITPREAAEKHGNLDDWKNMVGNGPFMLKEYVAGNRIVYEKNPNYHETDLQGRKIPFIDGFTTMIIKDDSTRWAALRTGKLDIVHSVPWRDAKEILKTNPNLQTTGGIPWYNMKLQFNVKEGVFADLKVRRAMALAIDHMSIVKDFHEGNSVIMPSAMFAPDHPAFMKLEEYPKTTQELYEYNPEKAKKLLAQAGYPKGFKAEMEIMQIHSDYASMLVSFWQATGLDIKIKVLEAGAFVSRLYGLKLNLFMLNGSLQGPRRESWRWSKGAPWNFSNIDDQKLWDLFAVATAEKDRRDFGREWQEVTKYLVDQVYEHQIPGPNVYNFWQPWVKNFHGEYTISSTDYYGFMPYIWAAGRKK